MTLATRKMLYFLLGAGGFFAAFPALLGVGFGIISVLSGEIDAPGLVFASLAGLAALAVASYTWLKLPLITKRNRLLATLVIPMGCIAVWSVITLMWSEAPVFINGSAWDIVSGTYVYIMPSLVGLCLLGEIWLVKKIASE